MALKLKKKKKVNDKPRINCYVEPIAKKQLGDICKKLDRSENYVMNKALDEYITNHYDKIMELLK
jgi:hypothetical protein